MTTCGIVLLNYNGYQDTVACLLSIMDSLCVSREFKYVIYLVDNKSTDDSVERIECLLCGVEFQKLDDCTYEYRSGFIVKLIKSHENLGYGGGNNIGIKQALADTCDYVTVLNNDTVVSQNFLVPLLSALKQDENIGIISSKINYESDRSRIWFNGGRFHLNSFDIDHYDFGVVDQGQHAPRNVNFISGCFWVVPRKVFEDIGLIKDEFFMYIEDVEFCCRVLSFGYKLEVFSDVVIYHRVGSSSGGNLSAFSIYYHVRNSLYFIWSINDLRVFKKIYISTFMIARVARRILKAGRFRLIKSTIFGFFDFIKGVRGKSNRKFS